MAAIERKGHKTEWAAIEHKEHKIDEEGPQESANGTKKNDRRPRKSTENTKTEIVAAKEHRDHKDQSSGGGDSAACKRCRIFTAEIG
jgi:hypothetical protein